MASHKDPVAVLGLGRFGTALALELARGGTEVLAVDNRPDVVQKLAGQLGQVVVADSTDPDALTEIGIADFSRVVVAIGNDLEASILTTALLAELEIRDIWAKAVSRQQATILERVGVGVKRGQRVPPPEDSVAAPEAHGERSGRVVRGGDVCVPVAVEVGDQDVVFARPHCVLPLGCKRPVTVAEQQADAPEKPERDREIKYAVVVEVRCGDGQRSG